ncbi:MAG TPA: hypothetical protein VE172_04415 [Stackebrandtia sp.]|jgi:hypothetical protein|uniref:hypothetical protein n=1 Tax=Stackebrandtia sp. TaxID=2023065 RepID=UPI002D66F8B9|nr:hypothetical protein [Stackebrandtia sp.]HZE38036.1 hypothetical protein [Stackebrandtia sp.]
MTNIEQDQCPLCRLRMSEAVSVVSRHPTSNGTVVYARCDCGRLSMWFEPTARPQPLAEASRLVRP